MCTMALLLESLMCNIDPGDLFCTVDFTDVYGFENDAMFYDLKTLIIRSERKTFLVIEDLKTKAWNLRKPNILSQFLDVTVKIFLVKIVK